MIYGQQCLYTKLCAMSYEQAITCLELRGKRFRNIENVARNANAFQGLVSWSIVETKVNVQLSLVSKRIKNVPDTWKCSRKLNNEEKYFSKVIVFSSRKTYFRHSRYDVASSVTYYDLSRYGCKLKNSTITNTFEKKDASLEILDFRNDAIRFVFVNTAGCIYQFTINTSYKVCL